MGAAPANDVDAALAALVTRLRRQLGSSEEIASVGRMTAGIAVELNGPLTSLVGSLSTMTELAARDDGPRTSEDVAKLRAALREATTVVDRIKDLVGAIRSVSHRDHRNAVFFDPARAIRNATKIFAVVHHRVCRVDLTMRPLPALHGSPNGLGQVILNLLQNGLDASRDAHPEGHARLAVTATATESEVQISVADDGPGIPADVAPHIFEEFFTTKDADRGRGMGLFLSRQIVTEMRGALTFESAPGRTVFTARLPFVD
jgi:two-component system C4-dicarboxylate transport sensor histidine kinase DctB